MDELFCLDAYNTTLYDGPKVSCCSYVIIVRTLIQLLDHYWNGIPEWNTGFNAETALTGGALTANV